MVQPPHDSRGHIKWGKVASLINCRLGYDLARGTIVNIWITETSRKHKKRKSLALESKDGGLTELIRSPSMERASVSQDHSLTGLSYPLTSSSHYSQSQPVYPQEKFPQYLHTQETHPPIYKSIQNVNEYVIAIKELQENDRALEILKHRQQEKIDYARSVQLQVCDKQLQEYMIAHKILILKKQTQIECVRTMKKLQEFDKALELLNIKQRVETEYTRSVKELKEHDRVLKILMHKQSVDKKTFLHNVLVCQQTALPEIPVPAQTDLPITTAESAASHSASSQNMTQELNVDDFFK